MSEAVTAYATDVAAGAFPGPEHSSSMDPAVLAEVLGAGALDRADMSKEPIPLDRDL